jgi:exopolysaccharide production protein ExoQ
MIPLIATTLCLFVIWQLFRLNWERDVQTSLALWIPTFWLFIAASRNVSEWLQYGGGGQDQYLEGSPLDRAVLTGVLALGVVVLVGRGRRIGTLVLSNFPILIYFLYCGISVLWSDFPDVAFKRWFRALGDVVMVLVVLSDPNWLAALRRLLARVGIVVVPLSILFIRYFPQLGRSYTVGGSGTWTGVGTDKNALGMISMVFGLAALFRFLEVYRDKTGTRNTRQLIAQGAVFTMALYLLWEANSATAFACFFLAGVPMVLAYRFRWARRPAYVNIMVFLVLSVAISALFLNLGSGLLQGLGRDSTLTGRTNIWHYAPGMVENPIVGTGFESFWLGPRLKTMEDLIHQTVNQAHNGYIEVYLNLGWVGIALLALILFTGYRRILKDVGWMSQAACLRLAYFIVVVAYNFTEGSFKTMSPVWIAFLLSTMVIPVQPIAEVLPAPGVGRANALRENELVPATPAVLAGRDFTHRHHHSRQFPRIERG